DAAIFHHQLPELASLADEYPDTPIVLNHMGMALTLPDDDQTAVFHDWQQGMRDLAQRPNVCCKIGGLSSAYWGFGFHLGDRVVASAEMAMAWRPYIETAIDAFGPDRCMLESNYPPDGRSCGYVPIWNAFKLCLADLSPDQKAAVAHGTAERFYQIKL
ncbi:MAG: amidohydrolase family protein, partial [Vibrio fluvialis]